MKVKMTKLLTALLVLASVLGIHWISGGHVGQLVQLTALANVLCLTALLSIHKFGIKRTFKEALAVVGPGNPSSEFSEFGKTWAILSANIVGVIVLLNMFRTIDKPETIGEGLAVSILSYLYGFVLAALFSRNGDARSTKRLGILSVVSVAIIGALTGTVFFCAKSCRP